MAASVAVSGRWQVKCEKTDASISIEWSTNFAISNGNELIGDFCDAFRVGSESQRRVR